MSLNTRPDSLVAFLNAANPNTLPDKFRQMEIGNIIRALPTYLRRKNMTLATNPYVLNTLQSLILPDDAKAASIVRATARAGTAGVGELTVVAFGTTPTTGQIAVAPNGDIVTLATDALTDVDILYIPEKHDIQELTLPVASNVLTIPTTYTALGAILLCEAEVTVGTATGKKVVLVPGASAPSAGQARLNLAKSTVTFATADAATQARVKLAIVSSPDLDAILEASSSTF